MPKARTTQEIYTFTEDSASDWKIVNDGVMGGLSQGSFEVTDNGEGKFYGSVSLENNGGFTMVRHSMDKIAIGENTRVLLQVKGDGKSYQFRIKAKASDYYSYVKTFQTTGEWETVAIPLAEMYPSFMGQKVDIPNFDQTNIEQVAFLISNKVAEDFELLVRDIRLE